MEQWQCAQKRLGGRTEKRIALQRHEPVNESAEDIVDAVYRIGAQLPGPPPNADRSAKVPVPNTTKGRLKRAVAQSAAAPCWAESLDTRRPQPSRLTAHPAKADQASVSETMMLRG